MISPMIIDGLSEFGRSMGVKKLIFYIFILFIFSEKKINFLNNLQN